MASWKGIALDHNGGTGYDYDYLYGESISGALQNRITLWATSASESTRIYRMTPASRPFKTLNGYFASDGTTTVKFINADGSLIYAWFPKTWGDPITVAAEWDGPITATITKNSGTGGTTALAYDPVTGKWYLDYPFTTELSASNPITIPTRTCYRFIGCYDTNSTSGHKCINADGTPTDYFLSSISPTSDITIYAQWEEASKIQTISSANGTWSYKKFYQSLTADSDGRYGYYSDDLCQTRIYGIPVPTWETYRWNGLADTTSYDTSRQPTGTRYANADGTFTSAFLDLAAAKRTIYGNFWLQVSVKLTLSGSSWTIPTNTYYLDKTNGGVYADWLLETTQLSVLPIPARAGYRFLGYYYSSTLYVAGDGTIQTILQQRTTAISISASGRAASYTLTLDPNGGTTTEPTIYYDKTSGSEAFFGASSTVITSVTLPTYTGNAFVGYYTEEQGGTQVIDANGNILSSWVPTATATVYAHWTIDVSIIDVDQGEGTGGTSRFYHRTSTGKFYSDSELTTEITSISVPSLRLFNLNGIYTSGGVLAVNASGVIQSTFNPTDEFVTLTATYTRFAYETKIANGGGVGTISAIYRAPGGSTWYSDLEMTTAVTNVGVPTQTGYRFGRYVYGSTTVINSAGDILSAAAADEDYTANAVWGAKTYTLTFNGNGATPSFTTKTVTYNQAIGTLPTLSNIPSKKSFDEWRVSGSGITAATVWTVDSDMTAYAAWATFFSSVKDWFNLGSATLIPESSDSGDTHQHTCAYNATSEAPATETGACVWRNPSVTYRVVGDMTLAVTLGAAFKATNSGKSAPTVSGYMISSVEVHTVIGEAPTVTVSAVANEGYTQQSSGSTIYYTATATDAIQTYAVSIPITARHRPQNLLSAISGGGELQELTLVARGDPVVLAENGMPCASDMTHGRIEVTARTAAYNNESAPTAGTNFVKTAEPQSGSGTGYKTFSVAVRKELT